MKLLHIHQDFPDGRDYPFTKAVSNLITGLKNTDPSVKHVVLSINRTSNPFKVSLQKFDLGYSLVYWAIPLKFVYGPMMAVWIFLLSLLLKKEGIDRIHAHKLTTEGMLAKGLSERMNTDYMVSVRGGSDLNNFNRLPSYKSLFLDIYSNAKHVFYVSPWAYSFLNTEGVSDKVPRTTLPNICDIDLVTPCDIASRERFIMVVSLHQHERKGVIPVLEAMKDLKLRGESVYLDIVGGGDEQNRKLIESAVKELGLVEDVNLLGPLPHTEVKDMLSRSKGLLLPAMNETFGMAYIESLACGCPILYMKNTGIDGYFDEYEVGVKVTSQKVSELSNAISKLIKNQEHYQSQIKMLDKFNYLEMFKEASVSLSYIKVLRSIDD